MKILVFYLSALLLMQAVQSVPLEAASSNTTVVVSFDNIVIKMLKLLHILGSSLPVEKSDDIFIVKNVNSPDDKQVIEETEYRYNDLNRYATKEGNYNFVADVRNFSIELYKAKATFEIFSWFRSVAAYQKLQEDYKLELLKVIDRFLNDMFNMLASNWKSFNDVRRIELQRTFHNKLEEIKMETDIKEKYKAFYRLISATEEELE